ncbi:TetR family transcriptional regulator [Salinisphaera shabanensis T35B1]
MAAHRCTAGALFRIMERATGVRLENMRTALVTADGRTINSYGNVQADVTKSLANLLDDNDIIDSTLGEIGTPFARNGANAVKVHRHWCAHCYLESRRNEDEPFDQLRWQVTDLTHCPIHGSELSVRCPSCGKTQNAISIRWAVDLCAHCNEFLWRNPPTPGCSDLDRPYQQWLAQQVGRLIIEKKGLQGRLNGREFRLFLAEMRSARNMSYLSLADRFAFPLQTLEKWAYGVTLPTLRSFFRLCANMQISPVDILHDPLTAAHQLELPFTSGRIYKLSRDAPVRRHDKKNIEAEVRAELRKDDAELRSIKRLSRDLNCPEATLYYYAHEATKTLTTRRKRFQKQLKRGRNESHIRVGKDVIRRLREEGLPVTRRAVAAELTRRCWTCSEHEAKALFPTLMWLMFPER